MDVPADDPRLARVSEICAALPGVARERAGYLHAAFVVHGRPFAYYLDDGGGAGIAALTCAGAPGALAALRDGAEDPERWFTPPYLGGRGWIGVLLDREPLDWEEVAVLLRSAHRLTAPAQLLADGDDAGDAARPRG